MADIAERGVECSQTVVNMADLFDQFDDIRRCRAELRGRIFDDALRRRSIVARVSRGHCDVIDVARQDICLGPDRFDRRGLFRHPFRKGSDVGLQIQRANAKFARQARGLPNGMIEPERRVGHAHVD
jgi:hypothetical protein